MDEYLDLPLNAVGTVQDEIDELWYSNGFLKLLRELGSSVKALCWGVPYVTQQIAMSDATLYATALYLPNSQTLTGIKFYQGTQGSFTGDNTNGVALYAYNAGTITKVAESANDENIFKGANHTYQTVPFATPYSAGAGVYFAALLYNNSAQVTAPSLGAGPNILNQGVSIFDFTNSATITVSQATITSFGASYSMAALTRATRAYWMGVY